DSWDWRFHKVTSFYDLDTAFDTLLRTRFGEEKDTSLQEALDKWEDFGWWFCFDNGKKIKIINKNTG
ncbi:MAG: hypothetical protein LUF92_06080, partial [Clostridiales bacterium]|nr:hypothetical protein [Clostridiales bacterium]